MKIFKKMKDGGAESSVTGYWLVEIKSLFSIVLLKFDGWSRDAFHSHAFNSLSWLIRGKLQETMYKGYTNYYKPSFIPFITKRSDFHKVDSINGGGRGTSWVLSFRGPWNKTWKEYLPKEDRERTLSKGRVEINGG